MAAWNMQHPSASYTHQELVSYPELNDALNCPALPQPTGIFLHTFEKVKGSFVVVRHCFRTPLYFDGSLRRSICHSLQESLT